MTTLTLNGRDVSVDVDPATPLLWVIRDELGATGTKGVNSNRLRCSGLPISIVKHPMCLVRARTAFSLVRRSNYRAQPRLQSSMNWHVKAQS